MAQRSSLPELRDAVLRTSAAADPDPDATERRIHGARQLRTWRDADGGWNLAARGRVADGARIEAARKPLIDAAYAKTRAAQRHEPREAYAFDALVALAQHPPDTASSTRPTPRTMTIVRVDVDALTRGRIADDREPFVKTKHTRLDELDPLCEHHHDQKTPKGWALIEGTGKRPIVPPDDPRHLKNRPKRVTA